MPKGELLSGRIGVFDSGLGGLSVWREIVRLRPDLESDYVGDRAHIPYGPRSMLEITQLSQAITRFLLRRGCTTIVVACNTASAAALSELRATHPDVRFVGMEPAVKPAALESRRKVVGILATAATFQGALFATAVERFAADVRLVRQVCPGLVELIESGEVDGPRTEALLRPFLEPSLSAGADTLVLACTHYSFVRTALERLAGPGVRILDPAPAVARQLDRVAGAPGTGGAATTTFFASGDVADFDAAASLLLGHPVRARGVRWLHGELVENLESS